jgi:hypothetical protein
MIMSNVFLHQHINNSHMMIECSVINLKRYTITLLLIG